MARRGVWELKDLMLKYSRTNGSSKGVREFAENGLIEFARDNPQIEIQTVFRNSHPFLVGRYGTGYARQIGLKNMSRDGVEKCFQYMRNSLGQKIPKHNEVSMGVINRKRISVQGIWHNRGNFGLPELPEEAGLRARREREVGFAKFKDEVGMAGVIRTLQLLQEARTEARQRALDALPKPARVLPTE